MILYFDSSALIKKYVREDGSDKILDMFKHPDMFITAKLAYPEILAGLGRKRREKGISEKDYLKAITQFESDWLALFIVEFSDELFPIMKHLASKYAIKGADMVHLASAIWIQKSTRGKALFIASDQQLIRTAKLEKLDVMNPENK